MKTITIQSMEFETRGEAIQYANASGQGTAIFLNGKPQVVPETDADRLETAGVGFAYLCDHEMPDGSFRIVTVPVN